MGVQNLQIIFDNPTSVFMPGQSVTGRVLIAVGGSVKIRNVKLKCKGEAEVSWTEQESRSNDNGQTENYSVKYDATEEYFENKITLVGGGGESKLEEGEHVYPFNISLPHQLPSTFNGEHGHVRYSVKVVIDIPWGKDKEKETIFEVISPLNLNDEPSLAEPIKEEKEKYYCCCCCESGPMTLVACIPYTGFVPGQIIPLTIELDNNSNVTIDAVKIILEREITFKASHPSERRKNSSSELALLRLQGIEAHASKTWSEQMTVPNSLMFANLKYCGIITDKYVLKVEAISGSLYENTVVNVKITMGNIPLTIAQDAPQYCYPAKSTDPNNPLNGQLQTNSTVPIGFIEPISTPGFPQQSMVPAQSNIPYTQPALYPQTQQYIQSQLPYPDLNTQQPAFNPSYPNLNPEVTSAPL
ncbi:Arrestin-like, N-terminal,Immunoglobulin E-set,Arrestin C-terminal-like domain [Cinara cedri]|uniref:Arrestin-like, N-terminal,Immunoglobulin E-set,Arrestin C-terminal-like domain n=1 Tax=Cinara cedri TaxID=506608 RepID=A0A5E4M6E9_9HEMI|nr:Arrestin-like, N-terminal,Immunoglobulin E-set,Arrestin C-terminal-like domain [Cinara cedri]